MKVVFFLALATLTSALHEHVIKKRALPSDESCIPDSGRCRKGDWIAERIAGCYYHTESWWPTRWTCDAVNDTWSWTVNVAYGDPILLCYEMICRIKLSSI